MPAPIKITDHDLTSLLQEVQTEVTGLLKSQKERLEKAHEGEVTSPEVQSDESATAGSDAPPASSSPEGSPGDAGGAEATPGEGPGADAPAPGPDGGAPAPDAGGDPAAAQGPMSPEELKAEYAQLDPETLKMHFIACKEALFESMSGGPAAGGAPAPDAGAPAPAAPDAGAAPQGSPAPDAPPALKAEKNPSNGNAAPTVAKSEKDANAEMLKKYEEGIGQLVGAFKHILDKPERKAVTSVSFLGKNGEGAAPAAAAVDVSKLSKTEITAKLKEATMKPLSKADADAVMGYFTNSVSLDKVAHLITGNK